MECETCRYALSARLDGEERPGEAAAVDAHLAGCSECRRWFDAAATITGLFRTGMTDQAVGGVSDTVLLAAPGPQWARLARGLRWILGAFGVAQFVLGLLQITTLAGGHHMHAGEIAAPGHLWHESAAWNVAIGVGFAWIAVRRCRPTGVAPMLTVFIVVLASLSVADVLTGQVQASWLLSHASILGGYAVIVLLNRPTMAFPDPPTRGGRGRSAWHPADDHTDYTDETPTIQVRQDPQAPAAHHHAA